MQRVEKKDFTYRGFRIRTQVTSSLATSAALSAPLLLLANITKRFGGTLALESIDWSVAPG